MPTWIKPVLALLLLTAVLVIVLGVYMDTLAVQVSAWVALSLILLAIRGWKRWLSGFRTVLPFLFSLILVYLLFGLFRVKTPSAEPGSVLFWLEFGAKRILLFINSVLAFQLFFESVGFDDLLRLPLGIGVRKYIILGKLLYGTALNAYPGILFHQRLIPSEQSSKLTFAHKFKARLASVLALLLTLISEARQKGELIDNRIEVCHHGKKRSTGRWYLILGFLVMVTVATMIIPIPVPGGGFFNFGDVIVVFVGLYMGKKAGALAGGIGSAIADLLLFPLFAPITLVVKGLEGFICGLGYGKGTLGKLLFPLLGTSVIVAGYFLGEWFMPQLGKAVAMADLPVNIVQAAVGFTGGRALYEAARYLDL
jgi:uncharacterized membrane protein